MVNLNNPQEVVKLFANGIDSLINLINVYVPNRHGSIAITRLEEAMLWANVMINSYPLKDEVKKEQEELHSQVNENKPEDIAEKKEENVDAA